MPIATDLAQTFIVKNQTLERYDDLLADVRRDGQYHSIRSLVQPEDPDVKEIAQILKQDPDFITAAQAFVNGFAPYKREVGDYWRTPHELFIAFEDYWAAMDAGQPVDRPESDCDDLSILLCSLLRAGGTPANEVYCAFGMMADSRASGGHMWVIMEGPGGQDRVIEATAHPEKELKGKYTLYAMFNDKTAWATPEGLKIFDLRPVRLVTV